MLTLSETLRNGLRTIAGPELQKLWFKLVPVVLISLIVYWLVPRFSFRDMASLSFSSQQQRFRCKCTREGTQVPSPIPSITPWSGRTT
jgi:hypothetical protein